MLLPNPSSTYWANSLQTYLLTYKSFLFIILEKINKVLGLATQLKVIGNYILLTSLVIFLKKLNF